QLERGICGVTAIVGPNGSGKSNVVDAVRWVLGEQSLKLLRGKKSTDVIFSGSAKKSQLGMAEVSLYLNNEDGIAPIDYSEVVITRKIYRDGSSEYLLNKNQVRLFDIVMLLAKANFGQNTYSVIGQGMVDQIVNYSPQERKGFFDEATGVKQFQLKRDRSVNKLKRSRENLAQSRSLLQELIPHLKSLTRQVNRLHRRREVEIELKELNIKYYGKLWLDHDLSYQKYALSFTTHEKSKIRLESQINDFQRQLEDLSHERGRASEFNRLQSEYDQKNTQKNSLLQQLAQIKGKLDVEYLKVGKQDLSWLENRREDLRGKIKILQVQINDLDKQSERFQEILDQKIKTQATVLAKFKDLEERLLQLQKEFSSELGVSEKEIRQMINRIYALQKDFISRLKTTHNLDALAKLKTEAEVVFSEIDAFYHMISQEEKRHQTEEMSSLQSKLSDFLKSKDLLVNEIGEAKVNFEVALSQQKSLVIKFEETKVDLDRVDADLSQNKLAPKDQSQMSQQLSDEKQALEKQVDDLDIILAETKGKIDDFNKQEEEKKKQIFSVQQEMHKHQLDLNDTLGRLNEVKVELAKIETKKEDLFHSIGQDLGLDYRPKANPEFASVNIQDLKLKILKLKKQLELIGGTDPEVEAEYNEIKERHDFLEKESNDLDDAIVDLEKIVMELDKIVKKQFEEGFGKINKDFSRFFKKLFDGGNAKLVLAQKDLTEAEVVKEEIAGQLENSDGVSKTDDIVSGESDKDKKIIYVEDKSPLVNMGIDIEACPPGKKIKGISMLSGGEKTMTALALICAIISNNPSPFILFDEVDAALDESNSSKFSGIVDELAHKTQFVIITHNRAVMARGNVLYGVTMQGDGMSRLISLKLDEAEKMGKK
ncbi:MAG TPA: AAA family ATPase, partial [Patescibacteria group bacterium]|nr:AAA family ATPase [Patescibacteria group bacterium]